MKKSENIEIRIDHATKLSLQAKAEAEDRNVSELIRALIDSYLSPPQSAVKKFRFKHYSAWTAAALILFFSGLSFMPSAHAKSLKLDFSGEVITQEGDGQRLRKADYEIELDEEGGSVSLPIGTSNIIIELSVSPLKLKDDESGANMKLQIVQIDGEEPKVIAEPNIIGAFDQLSRIEIGSESGTMYKINLVPSLMD